MGTDEIMNHKKSAISEGLAQGPYMAARVGFKPATFHTEHHHSATMLLKLQPSLACTE